MVSEEIQATVYSRWHDSETPGCKKMTDEATAGQTPTADRIEAAFSYFSPNLFASLQTGSGLHLTENLSAVCR